MQDENNRELVENRERCRERKGWRIKQAVQEIKKPEESVFGAVV